MNETKVRFPENRKFISKILEKQSLMQKDLAEKVGFKKQAFNHVYLGYTEIGIALLRKLKGVSGMSKRAFLEHFSESFKI